MTSKTRIIAAFILVIIIASGIGYLYYRNQLDTTVSDLEIVFDSIRLDGVRILPPEANLTLIYVANNTHPVRFRVSLEGELYYGSSFITPLTVEDALIRENGLSTFQMDVRITGSILNTIDPVKKNEYIIQGDLVATTRVFGLVPITVTKSLSSYQPGHK